MEPEIESNHESIDEKKIKKKKTHETLKQN